ncbi:class I SAM-dependent methyltransferase [Modestobacter sp. VKM Ac-2978]|uniref:class I SAM-dependent methyltransferase n=1 Tax=Modestobacter sp. VKM Ac-2978 TaxID=3004132 RepID=UPI0022AA36CE|nr:class I SAM-dependent methyltransferase [Modestobacter sp. VKM Ac-2978]MCZ2849844.1 class I SAM-dependent methyltransferase [Modestobacter sp. VKM Ac-2978]
MTSPASSELVHSHGPLLMQLLDLDAVVQSPMLEEAIAEVAGLAGAAVPQRILDVGAGTGTGTVALARRFAAAEVVAVDVDGQMLDRVRARAHEEGVQHRVTTLEGDVASGSPQLGAADLVWSSAALHEVADAGLALQNLFQALRPGGHLIVIEMDAPPRVLPSAFAEWETRVRAAGSGSAATDHPDWTGTLKAVGFEMVLTRSLVTDRLMPADGPAGDYAALELRRMGHAAMSALSGSDRTTLVTLAGYGAGNVRELGELWIRGTRTLWAARRP